MKLLEGKKTYLGLLIALLGVVGLGDFLSEAEASATWDSVAQIVGLVIALYGRFVARP